MSNDWHNLYSRKYECTNGLRGIITDYYCGGKQQEEEVKIFYILFFFCVVVVVLNITTNDA